MRNRQVSAATAFLAFALLFGGCWARSYRAADGFVGRIGASNPSISNFNGNVVLWVDFEDPGTPHRATGYFSNPHAFRPVGDIRRQPFGRFLCERRPGGIRTGWLVAIPHWVPVFLLLGTGILSVASGRKPAQPESPA